MKEVSIVIRKENEPLENSEAEFKSSINWSSLLLAFSALITPILVAGIGYLHITETHAAKLEQQKQENEAERQAEYINLGVKILGGPANENNTNLRDWAVKLINNYSDVKMSEKTQNELIKKSSIPVDSVPDAFNPNLVGYSLKWDGDKTKSYGLEVQEKRGDSWSYLKALSLQGNTHYLYLPRNISLRWRVLEYPLSDEKNNNRDWKKLLINDFESQYYPQ
ncbi:MULTISPECIES: hypothetical protein [Pseudoalteromonas]|uniref:Uncharacterized protein n=1 Tax=Pseudoalteromonas arctica TaxID=394751 RepID=A0ABU9TFD6_9GAMM|nr:MULTISPECIES: hypothetical protein [unclassified Pseudoalteromonas]MBB1338762.1 hypothetical protein [Pseudoalteromonas sp. SR44-2]GAA81436.1 hypothetical protein P20495_3968 [Pseudoalteromonas sp. BSi20495]